MASRLALQFWGGVPWRSSAGAPRQVAAEYMESYKALTPIYEETYKYLDFDQSDDYTSIAKGVVIAAGVKDATRELDAPSTMW